MIGRGGFWLGRPGRREVKIVSLITDLVLVILQASVCVIILFTDLTFLGGWIFILPPEYDWVIGMLLFITVASCAFVGDWLVIQLRQYPFLTTEALERLGWTKRDWVFWRLKQWPTWVGAGIILLIILSFAYLVVWDWWWDYCLRTPDFSIPFPIMGGGSPGLWFGVFVSVIGIIGFLLHPGWYSLGLTTLGGLVVVIANLFSPISITVEYKRPIILYCVYAAWCVAWIVGTASLFFRFWLKEIPDPYIPESIQPGDKDDSLFTEFIRKLAGEGGPRVEDPGNR